MKIHYIILNKSVLLSKKVYKSWRDIQNDFDDYKASLGPWSKEELFNYFELDYSLPSEWPFTQKEIEDFINSDKIITECFE